MIRAASFIVALVGLIHVASGGAEEAAQAPLAYLYSSSEHGWTIGYPDGWEVDDADPAYVRIAATSGPFALVGIHTQQVRFTDIDRLVDVVFDLKERQFEERGTDYAVKTRTTARLADGTPAVLVVDAMGGDRGGKSLTLVVLKGSIAIMVNAETYAANWPEFAGHFDHLVKSITLTK